MCGANGHATVVTSRTVVSVVFGCPTMLAGLKGGVLYKFKIFSNNQYSEGADSEMIHLVAL